MQWVFENEWRVFSMGFFYGDFWKWYLQWVFENQWRVFSMCVFCWKIVNGDFQCGCLVEMVLMMMMMNVDCWLEEWMMVDRNLDWIVDWWLENWIGLLIGDWIGRMNMIGMDWWLDEQQWLVVDDGIGWMIFGWWWMMGLDGG